MRPCLSDLCCMYPIVCVLNHPIICILDTRAVTPTKGFPDNPISTPWVPAVQGLTV